MLTNSLAFDQPDNLDNCVNFILFKEYRDITLHLYQIHCALFINKNRLD